MHGVLWCGNGTLQILGDGGRIRRTKASSGCPMLQKRNLQKQFKNEVCQSGALDMEDLVQLGKKIGSCPYYGCRSVVPAANLVILPYQSVLLKSARESLGLNLKNSIVIIDEAHNLADSLTNMYNTKITLSQVAITYLIFLCYYLCHSSGCQLCTILVAPMVQWSIY